MYLLSQCTIVRLRDLPLGDKIKPIIFQRFQIARMASLPCVFCFFIRMCQLETLHFASNVLCVVFCLRCCFIYPFFVNFKRTYYLHAQHCYSLNTPALRGTALWLWQRTGYSAIHIDIDLRKRKLGYRKNDEFPTERFLFDQNYNHSRNSFWKQSHLTIGNGGRPSSAGALPEFLTWFLKAKP